MVQESILRRVGYARVQDVVCYAITTLTITSIIVNLVIIQGYAVSAMIQNLKGKNVYNALEQVINNHL